jgi:hypothetical protein
MLSAIGLVAFVAAAALTVRWLTHRHDELGRARQAPTIAVPLLLIIALTAGAIMWRHHQHERRLTNVASTLIGAPAQVSCQTLGSSMVDTGGDLGYVKWGPDGTPERRTLIKRDTCNDLAAFMKNPTAQAPEEQVIAVHVLTHESMHMRGERAESRTECQAVQRNATTAALLGATNDQSRELARRYYQEIYPRQSADYWSADCAQGRALDEGLPDSPW